MWKRGKRSRSKSAVERPPSAISVDTVDPAGPPPITTTSYSDLSVMAATRRSWTWTLLTLGVGIWGLGVARLGVADARVLREEEPVQQRIDAHQPLAGDGDAGGRQLGEVAFLLQRRKLRREAIARFDAVLGVEVCRRDRAALQLQDELADQPLVGVGLIGAAERQHAGVDRRGILLPRVEILQVHA